MSLRSLLQHSVTISRRPTPATVDARGNPSGNYVADAAAVRAFVQAGDVREGAAAGGTDTVLADYSVYLEPTVTIDETCRIAWGAVTLEVLGVRREQAPGVTHHILVSARTA